MVEIINDFQITLSNCKALVKEFKKIGKDYHFYFRSYKTLEYIEGEEMYSYGYTKNLSAAIKTKYRRGYSVWFRTGEIGNFGSKRELDLQIIEE